VWENKYIPHLPYRQQRKFLAHSGLEALYGGAASGGKLLDITTPILTTSGWKTIETVEIGDTIFSNTGDQCIVLAKSDVVNNADCYKITFSDGSEIIAAGTHLWPAFSRGERNKKVARNKSTLELFKGQSRCSRNKYYIPVCSPLKYPEKNFILDPYVLGAWLGDGTSASSRISGIDMEIFDEITRRGYKVSHHADVVQHSVIGLITLVKKIGCYKNKHIPEEYFSGSVEQRLDLLRGIMDTDGYAEKNGECCIKLANARLIQDVSRLLHSLGIKHRIRYYGVPQTSEPALRESPIWRIQFRTRFRVFSLPRKVSRQENRAIWKKYPYECRYIHKIERVFSVPTQCIQVSSPNGQYLVGKSLIPTHNSDSLLMSALQYVGVPNYAALLLRRTYSDLSLPGALMDRAFQWLDGTDARWSDQNKVWTFPSGATITFGYLETEKDKFRYQSSELQFCAFDELTQFLETQYTYLFSRLRRLKDFPVPIRMRSATNPGGVGNDWVVSRFPILREPTDSDPLFVPASVYDNPHIDRASYINALNNLDYVTREQLLNGRWDVSITGGIFKTDPITIPYKAVISEPELRDNGYKVYGAVDPSEGGKDFASIATIIQLDDGRWLVYGCDMSVDIQSATIDKIIDFHTRYNYQKYG